MSDIRELGERIGDARYDQKLTQESLACKIGVTRRTVRSWEQGVTTPDRGRLDILARALRVSLSDLTGDPSDTGGIDEIRRLTAALAASEARTAELRERASDAFDCLVRALDGSRPHTLPWREEVRMAIDALKPAAAAPDTGGTD